MEECPILKEIEQEIIWLGHSITWKESQKIINHHRARCVDCAIDVMEKE